jgi:hypothetical protein
VSSDRVAVVGGELHRHHRVSGEQRRRQDQRVGAGRHAVHEPLDLVALRVGRIGVGPARGDRVQLVAVVGARRSDRYAGDRRGRVQDRHRGGGHGRSQGLAVPGTDLRVHDVALVEEGRRQAAAVGGHQDVVGVPVGQVALGVPVRVEEADSQGFEHAALHRIDRQQGGGRQLRGSVVDHDLGTEARRPGRLVVDRGRLALHDVVLGEDRRGQRRPVPDDHAAHAPGERQLLVVRRIGIAPPLGHAAEDRLDGCSTSSRSQVTDHEGASVTTWRRRSSSVPGSAG